MDLGKRYNGPHSRTSKSLPGSTAAYVGGDEGMGPGEWVAEGRPEHNGWLGGRNLGRPCRSGRQLTSVQGWWRP